MRRLAIHGGDLSAIAYEVGCDVADLVDFSANLNPLGPPSALLRELARAAADTDELQRYPEPDAATLRAVLGRELGVDPDGIVVANGAAALLDVAIAALRVRRCVVPVPAFSENARALAARGAELVPLPLEPDAFALDPDALVDAVRRTSADAVLLTNPHNPSGARLDAPAMRAVLTRMRETGASAIVDEAFVDFAPEAAVTRDVARIPATIAIRSLTKFYAVPALRVGYAVAEPGLAGEMRALLPSWPAGTLETRALGATVGDRAFARATLEAIARDRSSLQTALGSRGFTVTPASANFLLVRLRVRDPDAAAFRLALARDARVVVRDASSYAGLERGRYVRIAVRDAADNARLVAGIDALDSG